MRWESYNFTDDFQDTILACLIRYPEDFYAFGEIIKPAYFNGPAASELVFRLIEYKKKYGKYPQFGPLGNFAFTKAARVNIDHAKETLDYVEKLSTLDTSDKAAVLDLCLEFARERAIYDAIRKIHAAQTEGKSAEINPGKIMDEAMSVGINFSDLGVSLYHDYEKILRETLNHNYGVQMGYAGFEKLWKFGWGPGWLIALLAPPKRYKCLGINELVMMADGSTKRVQDVCVGDRIMGDDSTPRKVSACGKGHGPLYKVTQANGNSFVCNDAHVLCVSRQKHTVPKGTRFKNRYPPEHIIEITAKSYARKPKWFRRTWKGYKVGVKFAPQAVPLEPYFLGLWLGDGSSRNASIFVGNSDKPITVYLHGYANELGMKITTKQLQGCSRLSLVNNSRKAKTCSVAGCQKAASTGDFCHNHYIYHRRRGYLAGKRTNSVIEALRSLGVILNKHIPETYCKNNRRNRLELLAGLLDSDGNHTKNRGFIFVNINKQLCEDVCWVARSLGFKSYIRRVKTRCSSRGKFVYSTAYRTYIQGQISEIPTKLPRKRGKNSAKASNRTTIKVEPIGAGDYYGFEIDGNGRFLLGDFTVTHNTAFAINLALNIAGSQDTDVLYYACEITQNLAALRALTNLTNLTQDQLSANLEKGILIAGKAVQKNLWGNVWFKGYPSKSTSIGEIRMHAKQVIGRFGLRPKAIVIDYAETVRPDSVDRKAPDWRQQADIYTQARALGAEFGACVILPDRCNKETVGRSVPSMKSFQGSFEKAGIVDAAIGLCSTDDEYLHNHIRYFVFLNRHGDAYKHYSGTVDPEHMKMTVGKEIEYKPEDEDEDAKPRRSHIRRKMAKEAALTQTD